MKGIIRWRGEQKVYFLDGREVTEEEFHRALPPVKDDGRGEGNRPWSRPIHSEGAAVHPDQIPEAVEDAKRCGVPTEFDSIGCPIFTSRKHRRDYLKVYGFHDRNGGYGDG